MQKAVESWVTKRKYSKLVDLWVKGLIFDWNKLYSDQIPARLSLPTYPFARDSYWVPELYGRSEAAALKSEAAVATKEIINDSLLPLNTSEKNYWAPINETPVEIISDSSPEPSEIDFIQLIDEVLSDTISIDDAIEKIK